MDRQRKLRTVRRIVDVGLRTPSTTVRVRAQLGRSQIRRYDAVYINLYSPTDGSNTKTHGKTAKNLYIHTHPFNGPLSGTTQVSRYQKGKANLDFSEARDSEWQWHQLNHMQVCTSLQTDNHACSGRPSVERASVEHRVSGAPVSRAPQLIRTN